MLKHRKKTEGELRNVEFALALCYAILPQSPSVTAPSRREPIFNLPDKPEFEGLVRVLMSGGQKGSLKMSLRIFRGPVKGLPSLRGTCQQSDKPEFEVRFVCSY